LGSLRSRCVLQLRDEQRTVLPLCHARIRLPGRRPTANEENDSRNSVSKPFHDGGRRTRAISCGAARQKERFVASSNGLCNVRLGQACNGRSLFDAFMSGSGGDVDALIHLLSQPGCPPHWPALSETQQSHSSRCAACVLHSWRSRPQPQRRCTTAKAAAADLISTSRIPNDKVRRPRRSRSHHRRWRRCPMRAWSPWRPESRSSMQHSLLLLLLLVVR
jgi:hypothetical protein